MCALLLPSASTISHTDALSVVSHGCHVNTQVITDPSERSDLYGNPKYDSIVAQLKQMYAVERAVAVYPCLRGPSGKANAQGVLQPWLGPDDKCESH